MTNRQTTLIKELHGRKYRNNPLSKDEKAYNAALNEAIAIIRQHQTEQWQPAATAPTDGTRVDLWLDIPASPRSFGMSDSFPVTDCYSRDGKWWHFQNGKENELYASYITYWMSRPAPVVTHFEISLGLILDRLCKAGTYL